MLLLPGLKKINLFPSTSTVFAPSSSVIHHSIHKMKMFCSIHIQLAFDLKLVFYRGVAANFKAWNEVPRWLQLRTINNLYFIVLNIHK